MIKPTDVNSNNFGINTLLGQAGSKAENDPETSPVVSATADLQDPFVVHQKFGDFHSITIPSKIDAHSPAPIPGGGMTSEATLYSQGLFGINPIRVEPILSTTLDDNFFKTAKELIQAKEYEQLIDVEIAKKTYEKIKQGQGASTIDGLLQSVDAEIEEASSNLDAAEAFFHSFESAVNSIIDPVRSDGVSEKFEQLMLSTVDEHSDSLKYLNTTSTREYFSQLFSITAIPADQVKALDTTFLYLQIIEDLRQLHVEPGMMSLWLNNPSVNKAYRPYGYPSPNHSGDPQKSKIDKPWKKLSILEGHRQRCAQIGLGKQNQGSDPYTSNYAHRMPELTQYSALTRVSQICSQIAGAFCMSAGLGRLESDPYASLFGISHFKSQPFDGMFGTQQTVHTHDDKKLLGSLAELVIGTANGTIGQTQGLTEHVTLLDPFTPEEHEDGHKVVTNAGKSYKSVKSAFFDNILENPRNNNMGNFDQLMVMALERMNAAQQVMTKLHCYDLEKDLLSSRNLFVRVFEEFLKFSNVFSGTAPDEFLLDDMASLYYLTRCEPNKNIEGTSAATFKRRILIAATRLLNSRRMSAGGSLEIHTPRLSHREGADQFTNALDEYYHDEDIFFTLLMCTTPESISQSTSHTLGDESLGKITSTAYLHNMDHFIDKNEKYNNSLKKKTYKKISGSKLLGWDSDPEKHHGFIRAIVSIYQDLEAEAVTAAKTDDPDHRLVNDNRLTKVGAWDAPTTMMMILECFSLLAHEWIQMKLYIGSASFGFATHYVQDDFRDSIRAAFKLREEAGKSNIASNFSQFATDVSAHLSYSTRHMIKHGNIGDPSKSAAAFAILAGTGVTGGAFNKNTVTVAGAEYIQANSLAALYNAFGTEMPGNANTGPGMIASVLGTPVSSVFEDNNANGAFGKIKKDKVGAAVIKGQKKSFKNQKHLLTFTKPQEKFLDYKNGRVAALEVLKAAKANNFGQLFADPKNEFQGFLPVPDWDIFAPCNQHGSDAQSVAVIMETIRKLSLNDYAPIRLFNSAKAMLLNLREKTLNLSRQAASLRGDFDQLKSFMPDPPAEMSVQDAALENLVQTKNGRMLLRYFSRDQLDLCRERLDTIDSASEQTGFLTETISRDDIRAIKFWLDSINSSKFGTLHFVGFGPGSIDRKIKKALIDNLMNPQSAGTVSADSLAQAVVELKVHLNNDAEHFATYAPKLVHLPLGIEVTPDGISVAFKDKFPNASPAENWEELIDRTEFTLQDASGGLIKESGYSVINVSERCTRASLKNLVASYLLKKFAKLLLNVTVEPKDLIVKGSDPAGTTLDPGSGGTLGTTLEPIRLAAQVLGYQDIEQILSTMFSKIGDSTQVHEPLAASLANVESLKTVSPVGYELLYNMINTKPMFAGRVVNDVVRPSVFDRVYGIYVSHEEFTVNKAATQQKIIDHSSATGANLIPDEEISKLELLHDNPKQNFQLSSIYIDARLKARPGFNPYGSQT